MNSETQALQFGRSQFLCVYTNNLVTEKQRAARIAGINRSISLDESDCLSTR